jgi:hypothetical protein
MIVAACHLYSPYRAELLLSKIAKTKPSAESPLDRSRYDSITNEITAREAGWQDREWL